MPEVATGIDHDPNKQGGEPCVAGTRVPVRRVGHLVDRHEATLAEAAEQYGISLSDVHRALAYYYDHPDEMAQYDQRDSTFENRATDAEPFEAARDRLRRESDA
ncbi:DUF433 domain-containing protein [Aeromonas veronii]|jgi:uncharacterized protein (DUF433 family)|uniref:DUF433 domain-containing protein n=1 Tax=Aeromonas veronii TaxID=654 RepID=UPI0038B64D33